MFNTLAFKGVGRCALFSDIVVLKEVNIYAITYFTLLIFIEIVLHSKKFMKVFCKEAQFILTVTYCGSTKMHKTSKWVNTFYQHCNQSKSCFILEIKQNVSVAINIVVFFCRRLGEQTEIKLLSSSSLHASFKLAVVFKGLRQLKPVNGHPVNNVLLDGLPAQRLQRGN